MGKPTNASPPDRDNVSLHTQPGERAYPRADPLLEDDAPELPASDFDLPPLYSDVLNDPEADSSSAPLLSVQPPTAAQIQSQSSLYEATFHQLTSQGHEYLIAPALDADPEHLERAVRRWATLPPRVLVRIHGSHRKRVQRNERNDNNKNGTHETVTDFDVRVDMTPYLYRDAATQQSFATLRTVENDEKVRRGGICRKRAKGWKRGVQIGEKPSLREWCHRYCASHAGLKAFVFRRQVVGFDEERVRTLITQLVRGRLNYRGNLCLSFEARDDRVELFNDCKTNVWRMTSWIWWVVVLSQLWLLTWPYLFLRTKRFETVVAEWPWSVVREDGQRQCVSVTEDQWYNIWGRAISRAVMGRQQRTLDQRDLEHEDAPVFESENRDMDWANRGVDFVRAGIDAMNQINRQMGWGYDDF